MSRAIYPKATAPVTEAVLKAANERADRWTDRCAVLVLALASIEALHQEGAPFYHPGGSSRRCAAGCHGGYPCATMAAVRSTSP